MADMADFASKGIVNALLSRLCTGLKDIVLLEPCERMI